MSLPLGLHLALPDWISSAVDPAGTWPDDEAKMALAIDLARRNVDADSGGPFGAAVFDADHRLLAVGVNRVVPETCSLAHAESMAFMLAQKRTGRTRLNLDRNGDPCGPVALAASGQPCCQCYGAVVWAGIDRLLIGARSSDIEELTEFDEGPIPADWVGELVRRNVEVVRDIARDQARAVLRAYAERGGPGY